MNEKKLKQLKCVCYITLYICLSRVYYSSSNHHTPGILGAEWTLTE